MDALFNSSIPMVEQLVVGIIIAVVVAVLGLVVRATVIRRIQEKFKQKYNFLTGEYFAYYFLRDASSTLIRHECMIKALRFRKIELILKEQSDAGYEYRGMVEIKGDILYCYMKGLRQDDRALLTCSIPFNHRNELRAMNGVLAGVNQKKEPSATRLIFSRLAMNEDEIQSEFGKECRPECGRECRRIIASPAPAQIRKMEQGELQ